MIAVLNRLKIQHIALAGILLLLVLGSSAPVEDPDVWWHLQAGRDIWQQMEIPRPDIYSFTIPGQSRVAHEWLAEAVYYKVYELFGYQGLLVFNVAVLAAVFFLLYRVIMANSGRAGLAGALLIAAAVLNSIFWLFRPHIPAYLFLAGFLYLLYGRREISRRIWLLPVLMIGWVNVHGSCLVGLELTVVYLVSGAAGLKLGKTSGRGLPAGQVKTLAVVTGVTALATLVNPNTYQMWFYPFQTVKAGMITSNVQEWLSPDFHQFRMKLFLIYILLTFGVAALSRLTIYLDELANLIIFTALAMYGAGNLALLVFVSLPVLARHLSPWWEKGAGGHTAAGNRLLPWLPAAALILVAVFLVTWWPAVSRIEEYTRPGAFPEKAVRYMQDRGLSGNILNEYDWGGYLIWTRYPANRVFVDRRADLSAAGVIPDYLKIITAGPEYSRTLAKYKIDYILLRPAQTLNQILAGRKDWRRIYADETAVLYAATGESGQPEGRQPDGRQPEGGQPDGNQPDGRQSDGRQPDGRQPEGRQP